MTIDWPALGIFSTVLLAGLGLLLAAIRWLLDRWVTQLEKRFTHLEATASAWSSELSRLDREILKLKAELPERYVGREDWIRFAHTIDHKMDVLRDRLEDLRETRHE